MYKDPAFNVFLLFKCILVSPSVVQICNYKFTFYNTLWYIGTTVVLWYYTVSAGEWRGGITYCANSMAL